VKGPHNRFCCPEHVPKSVRQENCRRGRATFAFRQRAKRFARELAMLQGRTLTKEALLTVFDRINRRGYNTGYLAGRLAREDRLSGDQVGRPVPQGKA
jgi:hypothetical protein